MLTSVPRSFFSVLTAYCMSRFCTLSVLSKTAAATISTMSVQMVMAMVLKSILNIFFIFMQCWCMSFGGWVGRATVYLSP